jgi:hypothetical protein
LTPVTAFTSSSGEWKARIKAMASSTPTSQSIITFFTMASSPHARIKPSKRGFFDFSISMLKKPKAIFPWLID